MKLSDVITLYHLPDLQVLVYRELPEMFAAAALETEDAEVVGVELEEGTPCWGMTDLETVWAWIPEGCLITDAVRLLAHELGHAAPVLEDVEERANVYAEVALAAMLVAYKAGNRLDGRTWEEVPA